jgi:hypothetical protein
MEFVHVFLLQLYLGTGEYRRLVSSDMHFYSITECNMYAKELTNRYGNYGSIDWIDPKDRATAYCVPVVLDKNIIGESIKVY